MVAHGNYISMTRGDTGTVTIICDNRPFIDGDKVTFTIRENFYSPIVFQKTITVFRAGEADVTLLPADTSHLPFGSYVYDVELKQADGTVTTIIKPPAGGGNFELTEEVTY